MITLFDHPADWAIGAGLAAHFCAGGLVGLIYFQALWADAQRLVSGGGIIATLLSTCGRFGLIGVALIFASREGAVALLLTTTGIMTARHMLIARIKVDRR